MFENVREVALSSEPKKKFRGEALENYISMKSDVSATSIKRR